jgi:hypothetical protein
VSVVLTEELPAWIPPEIPSVAPSASTAAWTSRIGTVGAFWLGRRRPRLVVAALVVIVFAPVGVVRILIGSRADPTSTDSWGPVDAFVIVAALIAIVVGFTLFQSARDARTRAVRSARAILKGANPAITEGQLLAVIGSTARFDAWATQSFLQPLETDDSSVVTNTAAARWLFAQRTAGHYADWVPRFGELRARAFRRSRISALTGAALVLGVVVLVVAALIASVIVRIQSPGVSVFAVLGPSLAAAAIVFVVGWVLILLARYGPGGRYAILDGMLPQLLSRDPQLNRAKVGAMFARPYMYDMWLQKYPRT